MLLRLMGIIPLAPPISPYIILIETVAQKMLNEAYLFPYISSTLLVLTVVVCLELGYQLWIFLSSAKR